MTTLKTLATKYNVTSSTISDNIKKLGILRVNGVLEEVIEGMSEFDDTLSKNVIKKLREVKDMINEDARKMYSD